MKIHLSPSRAFTLLEIMLVVSIIALLLGAAVYGIRGNLPFAQDTRVNADLKSLTVSLNMYQAMNGFYPSTEQGLEALVTRPDSEPRPTQWRSQLPKVPNDPWQSPYLYLQPGKHNPESFDVYSAGKDRTADTEDDVGNWEK